MIEQLKLFGLLVTNEFCEACLKCVFLIGLYELNRSHVCVHQVTVVSNLILPPLNTMGQNSLSILLFNSNLDFELREYLREKDLIARLFMQNVYSDCVVDAGAITLPIHKS